MHNRGAKRRVEGGGKAVYSRQFKPAQPARTPGATRGRSHVENAHAEACATGAKPPRIRRGTTPGNRRRRRPRARLVRACAPRPRVCRWSSPSPRPSRRATRACANRRRETGGAANRQEIGERRVASRRFGERARALGASGPPRASWSTSHRPRGGGRMVGGRREEVLRVRGLADWEANRASRAAARGDGAWT